VAPKIPAKPSAVAAAAVVLALTAGCGDDGDDGKKALAAWAGQVCAVEVTGKIDDSKAALADIGIVVPNETPDALKARLVGDVTKLADANTAFAAALQKAGAPKVKDGEDQVLVLSNELRGAANGWNTIKSQLETLPTNDQKAFADGLRALQPTIEGSVTSSRVALDNLHKGKLGAALAAVPGCVGAPQSTSEAPRPVPASDTPSAPASSAPASGTPDPSASGSAGPDASPSGSASRSATSSASASTSRSATTSPR
jgi:hypothetical protein